MKKRLISCMLLVLLLSSLLLTGCGSSSKEVPDALLEFELYDCEYYENGRPGFTWTSSHDYDSSAHIDTVAIQARIDSEYGFLTTYRIVKYQYDRASDNWSVLSRADWSEPYVSYNDNLIGDWEGTSQIGDGLYNITIEEVDGDNIRLRYYIEDTADGGLLGTDLDFELSGSGTFTVSGTDSLSVTLELPDNMKEAGIWGDKTASLYIPLSIDYGVYNVWWTSIAVISG